MLARLRLASLSSDTPKDDSHGVVCAPAFANSYPV